MTKVKMQTTLGDMIIELYPEKAPITVANFLEYVNDGYYTDTVFHRVIKNFMIQGGGFDTDYLQKATLAPIKNEADNGLKNVRGSIAMARTGVVDSATSQFFINHVDNSYLDFTAPTNHGYGYCVFGQLVEGFETLDAIAGVKTGRYEFMQDVPKEQVVIKSVEVIEE